MVDKLERAREEIGRQLSFLTREVYTWVNSSIESGKMGMKKGDGRKLDVAYNRITKFIRLNNDSIAFYMCKGSVFGLWNILDDVEESYVLSGYHKKWKKKNS